MHSGLRLGKNCKLWIVLLTSFAYHFLKKKGLQTEEFFSGCANTALCIGILTLFIFYTIHFYPNVLQGGRDIQLKMYA